MLVWPWFGHWDSFLIGFYVLLTCHSSATLLPLISFPCLQLDHTFFPFVPPLTIRNLPVVNVKCFAYLISLTVYNKSAISITPPPPKISVWASKTLCVEALLILPGSLHCTARCVFLWAPPPPAQAVTPIVGPLPCKVLLNPNCSSRAWALTPTPHCSLHSTTDCLILLRLWHPLLGVTSIHFTHY